MKVFELLAILAALPALAVTAKSVPAPDAGKKVKTEVTGLLSCSKPLDELGVALRIRQFDSNLFAINGDYYVGIEAREKSVAHSSVAKLIGRYGRGVYYSLYTPKQMKKIYEAKDLLEPLFVLYVNGAEARLFDTAQRDVNVSCALDATFDREKSEEIISQILGGKRSFWFF